MIASPNLYCVVYNTSTLCFLEHLAVPFINFFHFLWLHVTQIESLPSFKRKHLNNCGSTKKIYKKWKCVAEWKSKSWSFQEWKILLVKNYVMRFRAFITWEKCDNLWRIRLWRNILVLITKLYESNNSFVIRFIPKIFNVFWSVHSFGCINFINNIKVDRK